MLLTQKQVSNILDDVQQKFGHILGQTWNVVAPKVASLPDGSAALSDNLTIWNGKDTFVLDCNDKSCQLSKLTFEQKKGWGIPFILGCTSYSPGSLYGSASYVGSVDAGAIQDLSFIPFNNGIDSTNSLDNCSTDNKTCLADTVSQPQGKTDASDASKDGLSNTDVSATPVFDILCCNDTISQDLPPKDMSGAPDINDAQTDVPTPDVIDASVLVNNPPILDPVGKLTITAGAAYTFKINAKDADGNLVSYSASPLPAKASFDPATGVFQWAPKCYQAGIYPITFCASDGKTQTCETIDVTVTVPEPAVITKGYDGSAANGQSDWPSLSADGHYVVYESDASNLVANDTNGLTDVFVYDRLTEKTVRISNPTFGSGKSMVPTISANGNIVAFTTPKPMGSPDTMHSGVFIYNGTTSTIEKIAVCLDQKSSSPYNIIGPDGNYVSYSCNEQFAQAALLYNRSTKKTERVDTDVVGDNPNSAASSGSVGLSIDAKKVIFTAKDPVTGNTQSYIKDRIQNTTSSINKEFIWGGKRGAFSSNGQFAFGMSSKQGGILYDSVNDTATPVEGNVHSTISDDGRFVATDWSKQGYISVYDRQFGISQTIYTFSKPYDVSTGPGPSDIIAAISANGKYLVFHEPFGQCNPCTKNVSSLLLVGLECYFD